MERCPNGKVPNKMVKEIPAPPPQSPDFQSSSEKSNIYLFFFQYKTLCNLMIKTWQKESYAKIILTKLDIYLDTWSFFL